MTRMPEACKVVVMRGLIGSSTHIALFAASIVKDN